MIEGHVAQPAACALATVSKLGRTMLAGCIPQQPSGQHQMKPTRSSLSDGLAASGRSAREQSGWNQRPADRRLRTVPLQVRTLSELCLGLQMVVEKMLKGEGTSRLELGREAFEERVWAWKGEYGGFITGQMRRMGASCDWTRERFTLDGQLSGGARCCLIQSHLPRMRLMCLRLVHGRFLRLDRERFSLRSQLISGAQAPLS